RQHLLVYDEVDVSLDVFPWNGHTTACEALWMGVPVVALRGRHHAGRMTASVLSAVGLPELIAETADDYCRIVVRLAGDGGKRADRRAGRRERMLAWRVCEGPVSGRGREAAYRDLWQSWCGGGPGTSRQGVGLGSARATCGRVLRRTQARSASDGTRRS